MNNKIKKGLGYFSFFILALGMLPLGNILANEKVEPTKFVIEQNNLEANGFKIANDQVLTSEDVVKLSNVKSVDNLVDVNTLTVSDDQLANVNQANPDGGLYNLTLTNGQQANITVPVVKEGSLTTTNSKGALIFKNLALSQEANNKEKVLEETGVYSVAFNNGYVNSDLTVDINKNSTVVKDTNLGLSKELRLVDSTDPSTSEDKTRAAESVGTTPQGLHTQDEMENAAYNGNVQQATTLGEENYTKTVGSAQRIEVTNEKELTDALNKQAGSNVRIVIMNDITLTGGTKYIKGANTFYTIEGNTPSVTLTLSNSGYLFTVYANNVTVSFKNINIVGSMADGAALNNGWRNASKQQGIITSSNQGTTFNFYDGFNVKNIRLDGKGVVAAITSGTNANKSYLNVFGGNYSNLANDTHGVFGLSSIGYCRMNMFGGRIEATYSNSVLLLNDYQNQNEQAIYGTVITNNRTGLGFDSGYRGISEPAAFTQDALTNPKFFVTGQAQVYDNWAVDRQGNKICPANLGSLNLNTVVNSNLDDSLKYAQRSPIINPMPGGKVSAGAMQWGRNGKTFDDCFDRNMTNASYGWSKLGGMPLAEIKYTNPALIEKYQNNGVVEGFDTDFTFTPAKDQSYVLTQRGKYRLVEREYQGRYYAVVVKDYTNLTVKSYLDTDLNNPFDTTSNVVQNNAESTIPTAVKEGFKAIEAEVVSNSDPNEIKAGIKLNPIYGTEGDQAGKIIGFQLNPNNSIAGIYDIEIKVIYHQDVPEYTVTFDKNKGTGSTEVTGEMDPQQIPVDETVALTPKKFDREGYTFSGWNTQADGSGTSYTDGQEVTNIASKGENVVLYAQWTPITYKVIFKSTPQTVTNTMEPQTLTYDKAETLSKNTLTNPGYHFTGWSTVSSNEIDTDYADEQSVINLASTQGAEVALYPLWEANTYTVVFEPNPGEGSTAVTGSTASKNMTYSVITTLTPIGFKREGYTFKNWNTSPDGTGTSYGNGVRVRNLTTENEVDVHLYAQWEPITYQVKFNANTGSGSMENQDLTFDKAANLKSNGFTKENYTFKGWSTTQDGTVEYQNDQEVKNLTSQDGKIINLYAVWEEDPNYNVVYNDNYGDKEDSVPEKAYVNKPYQIKQQEPTRDGYTLLGYNTDKSANEALYKAGQTIPAGIGQEGQTIKLYAIWQANNYEVIFDKNATSATGSMKNQEFAYDQSQALTTNSYTNAGYTFKGWATSQDGEVVYTDGQEVSNLTTQANGQVTLYAVWEANKYQVAFDANTGSGNMENQEFTYGQEQQLKENQFTKEGYTFKGWNTQANGEGQAYADQASVSNLATEGQVTLYAQWQANNYEVIFDKNATSATGSMKNQEFAYDQSQALTTNSYTNAGYTFKGWATSQDGEVVYTDGQEVSNLTTQANGQVTLYAVWEANKYQVAFDANTGSGNMENQEFTYGQEQQLKENQFTKEGYTFKGWNTQANGEGQAYADQASVSNLATEGQVTLYAQWQANNYTVKFDANGGQGKMQDQQFEYDKAQKLSANAFTKENYTFAGWATSQNGEVVYTDAKEVKNLTTVNNGEVTLYAIWTENDSYNVVYDNNYDSQAPSDPQKVYLGVNYTIKSETPTREGYTFVGWNTNKSATEAQYSPNQEVEGGIGQTKDQTVTLYAIWQANNYGVVFDKNATSATGSMQNQEFTYDQQQALTTNGYTNAGYIFKGWATSPDGEVVYTDGQEVSNLTTQANGQVTLYAKWEKQTSVVLPGPDGNLGTKDDVTVKGDPVISNPDNGSVQLPNGGTVTPGEDGKPILVPSGTVIAPDGTITLPDKNPDAGFDKDNTVQIKPNPDGSIVIPGKDHQLGTDKDVTVKPGEGSSIDSNGNIHLPNGGVVTTPEGEIQAPPGSTVLPDGTVIDKDGNILNPDGSITLPGADGEVKPPHEDDNIVVKPEAGGNLTTNGNGSVVIPGQGGTVIPDNGTGKPIKLPGGSTVDKDGTITLPDKNPEAGFENDNTVQIKPGPNGSIIIPGKDHQLGTDKDVTVKPGEGSSIDSNGNIHLPNGGVVTTPEGEIQAPPGSTVLPDGTVIDKDGNILNPDGSITLPGADGEVKPPHEDDNIVVKPEAGGNLTTNGNGSVVIPGQGGTVIPDNGTGKPIKLPGGSTVDKDGTITLPDKNPEAGFENDNTVQIKPGPNGSIIIPGKDHQLGTDKDVTVKPGEGSSIDSNGNIHLPNGGVVTTPEGEIQAPPGSTVLPDGTVIDKNGNILNPDGSITVPGKDDKPGTSDDVTIKPGTDGSKPTTNPDGSVNIPNNGGTVDKNGTITLPGEDKKPGTNDDIIVKPENGATVNPDGSVTLPEGGTVIPDNGTGKPIKLPGVTVVGPDGTITLPDKNPEAGFDKDNTVQIKPGPNGSIVIPGKDHQLGTDDDVTVKPGEGSSIDSNGNIHLPNGGVVTTPEGEIQAPPGSTVLPDGTVIDKNGNILNPDGSITHPGADGKPGTGDDIIIKPGTDGSKPTTNPDGSVNIPNGGIVNGNGTITLPGKDGETGTEDDVNIVPNGPAIVNPDGSVTLPNGGTVNIGKDCQIKVEANGVVTPEGIVINPGKNGVVDTKPYNANTRTISAENDDQVLDPAVVCSTSVPSVREDKVSNVKPGNGTNTGTKSIISVLLLVIIASFTTLIIRKRK